VATPLSAVAEPSTGRATGLICAALGALGFSFKAILVKAAYRYGVDAETLLCLRMGYALPWLVLMAMALQRREPMQLTGRDWSQLVVLGVLGYYVSSYLDFLGLRYVSAALERIVLFIYPSLVVLLSALFLGKPLTRRTLLLLAACYAGVALAVAPDVRAAAGHTWLGVVLTLGSALSFAIYIMRNGQTVVRLGSTRVTAYATSVACVLCIVQFMALRPLQSLVQPWQVHALGLAMALFSTVLPIWLVTEAIRRLGAATASMMGSLGPVFTIVLSYAFLGEAISALQLAGAAIVTVAVTRLARASAG